jgi:hypothetical protein
MTLVSAALAALSTLIAGPGAELASAAERLSEAVATQTAFARSAPAQAATPLTQDNALAIGLTDISRRAMTLSIAMEYAGGPEDLRCIYRGMAIDALHHLDRLSAPGLRADRLAIYADIEYLLDHARTIGPLADQDEIAPFTGVDPDCPRGPLS